MTDSSRFSGQYPACSFASILEMRALTKKEEILLLGSIIPQFNLRRIRTHTSYWRASENGVFISVNRVQYKRKYVSLEVTGILVLSERKSTHVEVLTLKSRNAIVFIHECIKISPCRLLHIKYDPSLLVCSVQYIWLSNLKVSGVFLLHMYHTYFCSKAQNVLYVIFNSLHDLRTTSCKCMWYSWNPLYKFSACFQ